jgi:hypothetical protein
LGCLGGYSLVVAAAMIIDVKRSYVDDPGDFIRPPARFFKLTATIQFRAEERWIIVTHNLFHYEILDARPPWYERERRKAEQAAARAKGKGERYEWPQWLPRAIPEDLLILTVERVLRDPEFIITFDTAEELDRFEPRLKTAFEKFAQFLHRYGTRPRTVRWRF